MVVCLYVNFLLLVEVSLYLANIVVFYSQDTYSHPLPEVRGGSVVFGQVLKWKSSRIGGVSKCWKREAINGGAFFFLGTQCYRVLR
jgi:hypothetical protein